MPVLYAIVTNHGFGHASRLVWILAQVQQTIPGLRLIINSTVPEWFFRHVLPGPFEMRPLPLDTGVIQHDSLQLNLEETLRRLRLLERDSSSLLRRESRFLREQGVGLILGDIPPLAADLAGEAGIPCWMQGNFGWDFIFDSYGEAFAPYAEWFRLSYAKVDRLFRFPFHEPMPAFPVVEDVGLPGGRPRLTATEARRLFARGGEEPLFLLSFGGMGLAGIPYENLTRFDGVRGPRYSFLTFHKEAPSLPNLFRVTDPAIFPIDVMPACEAVVTKPGFGTFADAYRTGTGLISLERDNFAETPLLMEGLERHFPHRRISPELFFNSRWEFLEEGLIPPGSEEPLSLDGNERIATRMAEFFGVPGEEGAY